MSATAPYIIAHVPVDELQIVNGPGMREMRKLAHYEYESNKMRGKQSLSVTLTLKTAASNATFTRTVGFQFANKKAGTQYSILGILGDDYVSIEYDAHTRTGRIW